MVKIENCPVCGSHNFSEFLELNDFFLTQEPFVLQKCQSCGFVFTNPRPDDKSLSRYYESPDYLSHHSDGFSILNLVYQSLRRINIKSKFSKTEQYVSRGSLLDIGCGTGELLNYFQNKKWNVKGIEPSESARKFAIEKYGLDIQDEPGLKSLAEQTFDVVTMWHVLEHVANLNDRIEVIFKLLKKSGYLIIALPNMNSWDAKHYGKYWAAYDVPRHLHHFSKSTITALVEKHQFRFRESIPMKMDAYFISMLSEKYLKKNNPYLSALKNGVRSNAKAKKSGEYSSLIYVFQK
ncbi:MAG: class I SAM-dependent methyltransferase [Bacteroidales bacterium]|nr:class I SAM-dependent methyltransferase [Bacteroidales bacterium]